MVIVAALATLVAACGETTKPVVPASVLVVSGDGQSGAVRQTLPSPLVVKVVDAAGRGVRGTAVEWTVTQGGGRLTPRAFTDSSGSPLTTLWTATDEAGVASATWILGAAGGPNAVMASAEKLGSVGFSASARIVATVVSTGWEHACAVALSGDAYCWGPNYYGELGNGTTEASLTPALVTGGLSFASITAGSDAFSCGLTQGGVAYCWGNNYSGRLGNGSTNDSPTPVAVAGGLTFTELKAGSFNVCGIASSGAAYCWGENDAGQIGDSTTTTRLTPTAVAGGLRYSSLSVGYREVCGIATAGATYCWGGGTQQPAIPVHVPSSPTFVSISLAISHACGIATDGLAYCWGANRFGQLGNGDTVVTALGPVSGGLLFTSLGGQWYHTCAATASGAAYCWGRDEVGEIGDGTYVDLVVAPRPVSGGVAFSSVSTSTDASCGLSTSGVVYCWGWNNGGQVGDGTLVNRSVPTRVRYF